MTKPELLGTFACASIDFEARRGPYARPVTIWHDNDMVGYLPREELSFDHPHARYVPVFLVSIVHIDPWPGLAIAASAAAAYRPEWLRLNPRGPHQRAGGLSVDGCDYEFYCANDGQPWPCPTASDHIRPTAAHH